MCSAASKKNSGQCDAARQALFEGSADTPRMETGSQVVGRAARPRQVKPARHKPRRQPGGTRLSCSEFSAEPRVQLFEPVSLSASSTTMVLACAIPSLRVDAAVTDRPTSDDVILRSAIDHSRLALNMDIERMVCGCSAKGKSLYKNGIRIAGAWGNGDDRWGEKGGGRGADRRRVHAFRHVAWECHLVSTGAEVRSTGPRRAQMEHAARTDYRAISLCVDAQVPG